MKPLQIGLEIPTSQGFYRVLVVRDEQGKTHGYFCNDQDIAIADAHDQDEAWNDFDSPHRGKGKIVIIENTEASIFDSMGNWYDSYVYPFEEGDIYYTLEHKGLKNADIIESVWDDQSEEIFQEDPDPDKYFANKEDAINTASKKGYFNIRLFELKLSRPLHIVL